MFHQNKSMLFSSILFLAQEKNQKNMHLKRIAKSSLRSDFRRNSFNVQKTKTLNANILRPFIG